MAKDYWRENKN